jgi:hypothetical protein
MTGLRACGDLGAGVTLAVAGGLADTAYHATTTGWKNQNRIPADFSTDANGNGYGEFLNVAPPGSFTGTVTITVTAGGRTGQVSAYVNCPSNNSG